MVQPDLWGQLLARGSAWPLMRQGGVLPDGAPVLGVTIEVDPAEHGFSVLRAALALRELGDGSDTARAGFERAANAFEALVRNGDLTVAERGHYRTIAAAAYHLASYSAHGDAAISAGLGRWCSEVTGQLLRLDATQAQCRPAAPHSDSLPCH